VRTDPAAITSEFPQLGTSTDVHWQTGTLAGPDERGPGPTDHFVEAVVRLSPEDLAQLTRRYDFVPAPDPPRPPARSAVR
jgi:hypothetical protein